MSALLAKNGHLVYATMRNTAARDILAEFCVSHGVATDQFDVKGDVSGAGVRIRALDVCSDASVDGCMEEIANETHGRFDVCVNNAGAHSHTDTHRPQSTHRHTQTYTDTPFLSHLSFLFSFPQQGIPGRGQWS